MKSTMRCLLFLTVWVILAVGIFCSTADVPAFSGPRLVCDEPEYFFGEVVNTQSAEHEFILRNEGDEILEITRVHSGCGCTVAKPDEMKVRPGGETTLRVRFSLRGRKGPQNQKVTVVSNDRSHPHYDLVMAGEALTALTVSPDQLFWGNIHKDDVSEQVVSVMFHRNTPIAIRKAVITDPMFSLETRVVSEGESYEFIIKTLPVPVSGPFSCALRVETDSRTAPEIVVPMSGRVVGDIYAVPHEIILDSRYAEPTSRFIIVRSSRNLPFEVLKVESPTVSITVSVRRSSASRHTVDLRNIAPRQDLDGANVRIVTDCETVPEILVPIRVLDLGEAVNVNSR